MKNLNKFQENLRKQILRVAFMVIIVSLLLFYLFTAFYNNNNSSRKLSASNSSIEKQVLSLIHECEESFFTMSSSKNIIAFFKSDQSESSVYQELYATNNSSGFKFDLVLFDNNENCIFSSFQDKVFDNVSQSYHNLIIRDINQTGNTVLLSYNGQIQGNSNEYTVVANKIDNAGYAMFYLKDTELMRYVEKFPADHYIIYDNSKQALVYTDPEFVSNMNRSKIDPQISEIKINNITYSQKAHEINHGLTVVSFLYKDSIIDNGSLIFFVILFTILIAMILNYYSKRISQNTAHSLTILVDELDKITKGELNQLDIHTNDEFEIIADKTNNMLLEINQLAKRNQQLLTLRKEIEIKQLESQFNPHFLYNTLETIRYSMILDQDTASDLILKLTKILRYSVSDTADKVTFKEDLEYIENFLEIMKTRFKERFDYHMKIDENCYNYVIPKLIIQPLIENSLRHNYKTKNHLSIWITADIIGNEMIIEVEDDGDGMKESELQTVRSILSDNTIESTHIGLSNVAKRLKLLYEDKSNISISSRAGIGTKVQIAIVLERN